MNQHKNLFLFFALLFLAFSCSSVRQMQVNVSKPTLVPLPNEVKKLVIVDKTQGNFLTAIEGVLSGEMIGVDKILSQECISGIKNPFLSNSNIEIIQHTERLKSENKTSTGFGTTMTKLQIEQIANQHKADALLVLEYFDSNFMIRDITNPNNVGAVMYQGYASAKAGIRIYLPKTGTVFYENSFSFGNNFGRVEANKALLIGNILLGSDALKNVSYDLGKNISQRFVSYRLWEDRVLLKGKTLAINQAERYLVAQDYENAISILEKEYKIEQNPKNKAIIAHNLGYCYEIMGDLPLSKRWLSQSYVISNNRKTQTYLDIINRRISEQEMLEKQNNSK